MEALVREWGRGAGRRVEIVDGDVADAALGVDPAWVAQHRGSIAHFFHLAAVHDMTATDEACETLNVGGTRNALEVAADLDAGCFHHVSCAAVSGDHAGFWDESMADCGQRLPTPFHRTKLESEAVVREESAVPWRIYRPSTVIGHSETGEMDRLEGPAVLLPLLEVLREVVPSWVPLLGLDLGDTNVVPVDYVARAMDHLAHVPGLDGEVFHLVNPEPQRVLDVVNAFARAAGAPRFVALVDREVTSRLPTALLPPALRPAAVATALARTSAARLVLRETVGRIGVPPESLEHVLVPAQYGSVRTEQALAGSGIDLPDLEDYAHRLWCAWEEKTGR
jgi:thioester reductase-like protein